MTNEHHPFENEIFNHFRQEKKEINSAIRLLKKHGYIIYEKNEVKI